MSRPETIDAYLAALEPERRGTVETLMVTVRSNLPAGFEEVIGYGMPSWVVPHSLYPAGYHCDPELPLPFLSVAAQSRHFALYHMGLYGDAALLDWFRDAWTRHSPRRLDMGKSCIRFRKAEHIPHDLIGELCTKMSPADWIARYEASRAG